MALEQYITYTETDPNSHITVAENTVTFAGLNTGEDARVHYDYGTAYFNGDLKIRFKFNFTVSNADSIAVLFMLATAVNDRIGLITDNEDYISVHTDGTLLNLQLCEAGSLVADNGSFSIGTTYYCQLERDDDGGVNSTGQVTLRLCTGNYYGESGASLADTLQVDCSAGEQNDYQYAYGLNSSNSGTAFTCTGTVSDLNLDPDGVLRNTQTVVEVLSGDESPNIRTSQVVTEVLTDADGIVSKVRASQMVVEVLWRESTAGTVGSLVNGGFVNKGLVGGRLTG